MIFRFLKMAAVRHLGFDLAYVCLLVGIGIVVLKIFNLLLDRLENAYSRPFWG